MQHHEWRNVEGLVRPRPLLHLLLIEQALIDLENLNVVFLAVGNLLLESLKHDPVFFDVRVVVFSSPLSFNADVFKFDAGLFIRPGEPRSRYLEPFLFRQLHSLFQTEDCLFV